MLDGDEEPDFGVLGGLADALQACRCTGVADRVPHCALMGKSTLLWSKPMGGKRLVGKDEEANDSNDEGDGALKDE